MPEEEALIELAEDPRLTRAVLAAAKTETRSQSMGSRVVRRSTRLYWDSLVSLFGDEDSLQDRVAALKQSDLELDHELLSLVERYLSGWRPDEFGAGSG